MNNFLVIVEVFLLSLVISLAIKYFAPSLMIAPSATNALILVISPTLILSIALLARLFMQSIKS